MWSGNGSLEDHAAQLRACLETLRRTRWRIAAWCALCTAAALFYVSAVPAQFVAGVVIELAPQAIANDGPEVVRHFHQIDLDSAQAATELNILSSERLLRPVFEKLSLADSPELLKGSDGIWQAAARTVHRVASGAPAYDDRQRAYFVFADRVRCLRQGLSYVFLINYRSHDPALAARVANAVAAAYLSDRLARERIRRERAGSAYGVARSEALARQVEIGRIAAAAGIAPSEELPAAAARIISTAAPPLHKSYPKTAPMLALGALIGLLSGVIAALTVGGVAQSAPHEWARDTDVSINNG